MDKTLKIALILTALDKMSEVVDKSVEKSTSKLKHFQHGVNAAGTKSIIAGAAITEFMSEAVEAAEESEIATSKLENVFTQMGEKTNEAAEAAANYAGQLQYQIGVEDEVIMAVQTKLATFKKASNEGARQSGLFNRITKAAFDLEAAGFGDAQSMIVQLGKAFNDPIHGAMALKKAGTLTAKEVSNVKLIAETKGLAAAQKYMIQALEKQVKGTAEKNATAAKKAKIAWGELQERIGTGLIPIVNKYIGKVVNVIDKIAKWVEKNPELVRTIAAIGVGLLAFGAIMKVIASVVGVWNNLAKAIRFVGVAFQFVSRLFMTNPILLIVMAIAVAVFLVIKYWDKIRGFFIGLWAAIKALFWKVVAWIKDWGFLFMGPVGLIIKYWGKISKFFSVLWSGVKATFIGFHKWLFGLAANFFVAGKNIVMSIWNGIKSFINKPIDAVKGMVKKIRNFLPFSPAKEGPLRDIHRIKLVETIAESIKVNPVVQAMQKVGGAIFNTAGGGQIRQSQPLAAVSNNSNAAIQLTYAPVINGADRTIMDSLKAHDRELVKLLEEAMRKRDRTKF